MVISHSPPLTHRYLTERSHYSITSIPALGQTPPPVNPLYGVGLNSTINKQSQPQGAPDSNSCSKPTNTAPNPPTSPKGSSIYSQSSFAQPNHVKEWLCCQCGHMTFPASRYNCSRCLHDFCPYCPRRRYGESPDRRPSQDYR